MSIFSTDTIAAVSTPPGEGGIAVIRISGDHAIEIAAKLFRPHSPRDINSMRGYTCCYGKVVDQNDTSIDDAILTLFHSRKSFTGEDTVELSIHGGRSVTQAVLHRCCDAGCRLAEPGEFSLRAFKNGKLDLAQAEAVADLISARTNASARQARLLLEGSLSLQVKGFVDELIGILAAIEVTIDFSEEVGELDFDKLIVRISKVRQDVDKLLSTADRGRMLREGVRIAIVGRPNVGKSSLLNALLGTDRAIVSAIPGTTRDLVEETAQFGGAPVVLVDTAGIREASDLVERMGVERTRTAATQADVLVLVYDLSAGRSDEDLKLLKGLNLQCRHQLLVGNKADRVVHPQIAPVSPFEIHMALSATTGQGMNELKLKLSEITSGANTEEVALVTRARHQEALLRSSASLQKALQTCQNQLPGDFVAIDVRGAMEALGEITGATASDEIIHRIFKDFCVGK